MWGIPTRKTIPYHFNMTTLYHVFGIAVPGLSQKRQRSVSAKLTHEASLAAGLRKRIHETVCSANQFHVQRHFREHLDGGTHISTIAIG
jgi:hypothetical protein